MKELIGAMETGLVPERVSHNDIKLNNVMIVDHSSEGAWVSILGTVIPTSGCLITLEIGIRLLMDYLEGDHYFKVHREDHNLQRCRTQIALARSIERHLPEMELIVKGEVEVCA